MEEFSFSTIIVENFAVGNKWEFETKEGKTTSLPSLAMQG